jgi:hypothetical protein
MKYACLVYQEESKLAALSDAELGDIVAGCAEWVDELERSGRHVFSAGLQSFRTAAAVRIRDGRVLTTDGPFAETKECLGGFTIFEARDFNEAMQVAARLPAARSGTVEVRALMDPAAVLSDPVDRKVAALITRNARPMTDAQAARSVSAARPA